MIKQTGFTKITNYNVGITETTQFTNCKDKGKKTPYPETDIESIPSYESLELWRQSTEKLINLNIPDCMSTINNRKYSTFAGNSDQRLQSICREIITVRLLHFNSELI